MTRADLQETQAEAMEICRHATADYRQGGIQMWQWWEVVHRAMTDFWLAIAEWQNESRN